jgi:hypothetical protein
MEPLWSPVVATGGNQRQIGRPSKPQKQAKSVAARCHRLPAPFHGKEGVDGSSPSEGSAKCQHSAVFVSDLLASSGFGFTCKFANVEQVWSSFWSFQVENTLRDVLLELAALEPATSWMRERVAPMPVAALTGRS